VVLQVFVEDILPVPITNVFHTTIIATVS